jgi:hypothetical protein
MDTAMPTPRLIPLDEGKIVRLIEIGDDAVLAFMASHRTPLSRESYLHVAYCGSPPEPPDEWDAECEAGLPEAIRLAQQSHI